MVEKNNKGFLNLTPVGIGIVVALLIAASAAFYFLGKRSVEAPGVNMPSSEQAPETTTPEDIAAEPAPPASPALKPSTTKPSSAPGSFPISESGPAIVTKTLSSPRIGENYAANISASGGGRIYTWKFVSGSLPPGLKISPSVDCIKTKFDPCQPTYNISGVPTKTGTYKFAVSVADSKGATIREFTIIVEAELPPQIETTSLPNGVVRERYEQSIKGIGGGNNSYSWTLVTGFLPSGLSVVTQVCQTAPCQAPALVTGTPTSIGTYTFTVMLTAGTKTAQKEFTITIRPE